MVGAGLIGVQSLNAMIDRGKRVVLVETQARVMPAALDGDGSRIVEAAALARGVDLHLNEGVERIEASGGCLAVSLSSGGRVEGGVVILATGVKPNAAWLDGTGVARGSGVLVDEHCETSIAGIYAAGDVAEAIDGASGARRINATLLNAAEQGRVAGLNKAGVRAGCLRTIQVNAFSPLGVACASAGVTTAIEGRHETLTTRSGTAYRKLILEGERLVGMVLVGDVDAAGILAASIERGDYRPRRDPAPISGLVAPPAA